MTKFAIFTVLGGWIYVGTVKTDGPFWKLVSGKCIRYWGTRNGLGELENGPTSTTKLDPANGVEWHMAAAGPIYPADEKAWKKHIK